MEGKKRYFAIILFLFLALMIFTFANSDEETLEDSGNKKNGSETEEVTNKKSDEDTTLELAEENDTNFQIGTYTVTRNTTATSNNTIDDSYDKALAAVILAEKELTNSSVISAQELVDLVSDNGLKEELVERLDDVKDSINAIGLVETLEKLVNEALNKADMNDSRDYRTDEEVVRIVSELTNAAVKNDLESRLAILAEVLDDLLGPEIAGIDNGAVVNTDVAITATDDNAVTFKVTLNGEEIPYKDTFDQEGTYVVTAMDAAFNETTITFTIDKTAATATVTKSNNDKGTNKDVVVTIVANEAISTPEGWTVVTEGYEFTKTYSENGKYEVDITDKAGNQSTIKFEVKRIDKVAPEATVTMSNKNGLQSTNQDVIVTIVANEAIFKPEGWTEVETNKEHEFTKVYSENGKYEVVITDKGGNQSTIKFEVKRIDKVAPVVTVVDPNKYQLEVNSEYVDKGYSAWDEVDKDVTNLIKITYQFQAKGTSAWPFVDELDTSKLGTYKVIYTAYDKAGNSSKGTRTVEIVDTIAPTLTVKEESVGTDPYYSEISFALSDSNKIDYFEVNGEKIDRTDAKWSDANYGNIKKYLVAGENTIVLYDTAGNKTEKTFYMDWTAPTVAVKNWIGTEPNYSGASFKLSDNYAIDYFVVNGKEYDRTNAKDSDANYDNIKGSLVDGENTLVLYDAAGNSTTYTFTLERVAPTITVADGTVGTGPYSKLNLKMHDASGIASVVINGTQLPHTGYYVDVNDGHAYTFLDGTNTVVVTDNAGNVTTQTFVVDRSYISNQAELEAAFAKGGKYKLGANITANGTTITISNNAEVELNLNGYSITNPVVGGAAIENNGNLTITGNGSIVNGVNYTKASHTIVNNGTLVIESGNIGTDYTAGAAVSNYGTAIINGGTFASKQENVKADGLCAYVFINNAGTMTINNATVNGATHGIFAANAGELIVKGGNYTLVGNNGLGCYVAYASSIGKVTLDGGTIHTKEPRNSRVFYVYDNVNYFDAAAVNTGKVVVNGAIIYLNDVVQNY